MQTTPFRSDRKFSLYEYHIGHRLLLFRSGKTDEHRTRIDLLITDVRAMEIRVWLDGFEITEVGRDYLRDFRSNPDEMMEEGLRVYAVTANGWQGYVLGGRLWVREDDAEFTDPGLGFSASGAENTMRYPATHEIEAAARVLDKAGRHHHWWSPDLKPYDDLERADPIAKSEFDGIVVEMLVAARKASF